MPILLERRYRSIGRVYVCDGGSFGHVTLPESFTDCGPPPAAAALDIEVLISLVALVSALEKELDSGDANRILLCTGETQDKGCGPQRAERAAAADATSAPGPKAPGCGDHAEGLASDSDSSVRKARVSMRSGGAARTVRVSRGASRSEEAAPVHPSRAGRGGATTGGSDRKARSRPGGDLHHQPRAARARKAGLRGGGCLPKGARGTRGKHAVSSDSSGEDK